MPSAKPPKTFAKPPKERNDFDIIIVTPDKVVFEDKSTKTILPGKLQDIGILPNHAPLYAQLTAGDAIITTVSGEVKTVPIESGIVRVRNNQVSIVIGFETYEMVNQL